MTPPPTLVKLPDGSYVNPAHVVSIMYTEYGHDEVPRQTVISATTHTLHFPGDQRDTLAEHINNPHHPTP